MKLVVASCRGVNAAPLMSPKQFAFPENQRILHRGQLLIEADLVFFEVFAPHKASLVVCFFSITVVAGKRVILPRSTPLRRICSRAGTGAVNENR